MEEVLTQRERRIRREEKICETAGHDSTSETAGEPFHTYEFMNKQKDINGKPLLKWGAKGKTVRVSTDLPHWSGKLTLHAFVVTAALYGKNNTTKAYSFETEMLPDVCPQATAMSMVLNHHMGRSLRGTLWEIEILQEEKKVRIFPHI